MVKRKHRTLQELYNVTAIVTEPEITQVLQGCCRMQGPLDEIDSGIKMKMVSPWDEQGFNRPSKSQKVDAESKPGTCNMCHARCSSCLHVNHAHSGSKTDKFSDGTRRRNVSKSKASLRTSDVSAASEDANKFENPERLEGHDDNIMCVVRAVNEKKLGIDINGTTAKEGVPCSVSSSTVPAAHGKKAHLVPCFDDGASSTKVQGTCFCPPKGETLSRGPNVKVLEEDSCSPFPGESSERPKELLNQSYLKAVSSGIVCGRESSFTKCNDVEKRKVTHFEGSSSQVAKGISPNIEAKTGNEQSPISVDTPQTSLHYQPEGENDECDSMEHDVKVCDTCGDAGREDLLALCSRCSDGAEHIYCMRERLFKVPGGDWMCEDCRFDDKMKNQKPDDDLVAVDRIEKNLSTRHSLEPVMDLSKTANVSRLASLSRDKGKTKSGHQSSSGSHSIKGSLLKSYSFNSSNVKPKAKLADEVVLQRHKAGKEPFSLDGKEGDIRVMRKSMSFGSANSGLPTSSESKIKMTPHKFSHVQDLKLSKVDKKPASRAVKAVQSDSKSISMSKSTNCASLKASEIPGPLGQMKRQSCATGSSLTTGTFTFGEQKLQQIRTKNNPLPKIAETPVYNVSKNLPEELLRPKESTNRVEIIKDSSINHKRQNATSSVRGISAHRYKEIGHNTVPFCTVDASSVKISREVINDDNKSKATNEVAIPEKHGIDQTDELSASNTNLNCEITSRDQISKLNTSRNICTANEVREGQSIAQNSTLDSRNQTTIDNVKKFLALPTSPPNSIAVNSIASATMSVALKMSAIPDYKYIWQGGFEIHRNGKFSEFCDGIQAHLSTCASPKVLEAVKKFPGTVILTEVPRVDTWPMQFQEIGAKEDNIALYFFAKDIESYKKSYGILVKRMMKSDVALRVNFDGVELLIFPSNQLPEKSQRWNSFYFLWGVFRVKSTNCSGHSFDSQNKLGTTKDLPISIPSFPANVHSLEAVDKDVSIAEQSCSAAPELPCLKAKLSGAFNTEVPSLDPNSQNEKDNIGGQDRKHDSGSLKIFGSHLREKHVDLNSKLDAEISSVLQAKLSDDSNVSEKTRVHWITPAGRPPHSSPLLKILPEGSQIGVGVGVRNADKDENAPTGVSGDNNDQVKIEEAEGFFDQESTRTTTVRGSSMMKNTGFRDNSSGSSSTWNAGSGSLIKEESYDEARETNIMPGGSSIEEQRLFAVDPPLPAIDFGLLGGKPASSELFPSNNNDWVRDSAPAPTLELALWGDMKPPPSRPIELPLLDQAHSTHRDPPENPTNEGAVDDVSVSLSLSLPFVDEEPTVERVEAAENVSTSLDLFGGFSGK